MNKFSALLLGASLVAGASFAASPSSVSPEGASPTYYYWLHPKLGMVKVDKATHAMVKSKRSSAEIDEQRSQKSEFSPTLPPGNVTAQ